MTAGQPAWACEDPQLLQAISRARTGEARPGGRGGGPAVVCLSGNPASAGWTLLHRLVNAGVDFRYHGDFDWSGVEIAGRVFAAGARPWRMSAADYHAAVDAQPPNRQLLLTGRPVTTWWDRPLAAAMRQRGTAVHEEALVSVLLGDVTAS